MAGDNLSPAALGSSCILFVLFCPQCHNYTYEALSCYNIHIKFVEVTKISNPESIVIHVKNPGRNREIQSNWAWRRSPFKPDTGLDALEQLESMKDPWLDLAFWESTYQAREGIESMCRRAYFQMDAFSEPAQWVPTRLLYPHAVTTRKGDDLNSAVAYVTAAVRQGREYYTAAHAVSEEARPTLYYYSALMLAQAAVGALLGLDELETNRGHGLSVNGHPRLAAWPQLVTWQRRGNFVSLYRIVRWDTQFGLGTPKKSVAFPQFHVMECLRRLNKVTWGDEVKWAQAGEHSGLNRLMAVWDETVISPYLRFEDVGQRDIYDVPDILVELMVLYYFSIVARYHPVAWQRLLAGEIAEGYFIRRAADEVYGSFIRHVKELLPYPQRQGLMKPAAWVGVLPDPIGLQQSWTVSNSRSIPYKLLEPPGEWEEPSQ